MDTLRFRVDAEKCIQCDACVNDCPSHIIHRHGATPEAALPAGGACLECQHCLAVCPSGAISVFGLQPENSLPLIEGAIPSYRQMKTFVRGRRSVRRFGDEELPPALVDELLADLAHAPTGCNDRDLTFLLVSGREAVKRLLAQVIQTIEAKRASGADLPGFLAEAAAAYLDKGKDEFFEGAPHLLIVTHGEKAHCGREDVALALAYFELLAQSAGIGTTWCGMLKFLIDFIPETRSLFGLSQDAYCYAMIFGKPAVRYARTVQRDTAARIRRLDIA
jgi:ferredoxin